MLSATNFAHEEGHQTTQVEKKFIYKWRINNFSCAKSKNLDLPSTEFKVKCEAEVLAIGFLRITGSCNDRYCSLRICDVKQNARATIAKLWVEEEGVKKSLSMNIKPHIYLELHKRLKESNIQDNSIGESCFLCKGVCTIICEITTMKYITKELEKFHLNQPSLRHDVELFNNKKHCDVVFKVSSVEVQAHKCILASRNEVFAAMFEHDMIENKLNTVTIEDTDPDVFEDMLRYIYTGEVMNLRKYASELLAVSEKYGIQDLKSLCIHEISCNITVENAAETLHLSDLYKADKLKNYIIKYINSNREKVVITEGWKKFLIHNVELLTELFVKSSV